MLVDQRALHPSPRKLSSCARPGHARPDDHNPFGRRAVSIKTPLLKGAFPDDAGDVDVPHGPQDGKLRDDGRAEDADGDKKEGGGPHPKGRRLGLGSCAYLQLPAAPPWCHLATADAALDVRKGEKDVACGFRSP